MALTNLMSLNWLVPGVAMKIDNSRAVRGLRGMPRQLLLFVHGLVSGTAPSLEPLLVLTEAEARAAMGEGSMWFLMDTSKVIKPLLLQNRKKAEFVTKTDPNNSDHVFMKKEYLYGADARMNVGYTFPQLAVGAKVALNAGNFETACAMLRNMETDGGKKLSNKPTLLVVGPNDEAAAQKLVKAMNDASGASNIHYNKCDILVSPYL